MQIVWQSGETPIKKRAASACTSCRSRKKKCYHVGRRNIERVERTGRRIQQERPSTTARKTSPSPGRVSEYNPESILAALSEDAEPGPSTQILEANTTALHPTPSATTPSLSTTYEAQRRLAWYKEHKTRAAPPPLSDAHRRYLEDEGAFLILPKTTTDALLPLYISTLDDLTPITHGTSIFRSHSNNQASAYLVRAICLVVCKTTHATPFLRLTDPGPLLEPLDFASRLLAGLDAVIKADLEPDRVTKMQILALMHLHNDGLAGVDRASSHLSQAICEAWSLGIHLKIPDSPDKERCEYLWWSLRNFDRLGKPIMAAAPFFIDDADVGIERIVPEKGNYRSQIMAVALGLGDLMTVATKAYKAGARAAVDSCAVFPQLEDVVRDVDFEGFHRAHRRMISFLSISRTSYLPEAVYLETWYHVAAMLSCRYSGPGSVQYSRRFTSAHRVLDLVSNEGIDAFPPLPLVPYAMSMSTTVIYRALHDGERGIGAACEDLRRCCEVLDGLGRRWTSVRGVGRLAERLWGVIESGALDGLVDGDGSGRDSGTRSTTAASGCSVGIVPEHGHTSASDTVVVAVQDSTTTLPQEPRLPYNNEVFQRQLTEIWPGIDTSYSQIDWTFQDWFDWDLTGSFDYVAS
ncbi:conserved hypothetical protein [Pyrenophora tritici-repentis Pt-1C-BFP]|uniref:Fungal-trans multi-domain protein n=1 Tax=Pyrenophora tritici-repentis (strain Pt-1C-BFP) TaxID=426418 RepID=B2WDN3_PYRTR|nr:uncharacterized protein PTRG_08092 [Pyrenophora tritici-repentis Pt-1C-BFP]EDU51011.1 conserved hypothetical protein [Pyrenophora tritici-repentis Pt-1C-BFP]